MNLIIFLSTLGGIAGGMSVFSLFSVLRWWHVPLSIVVSYTNSLFVEWFLKRKRESYDE